MDGIRGEPPSLEDVHIRGWRRFTRKIFFLSTASVILTSILLTYSLFARGKMMMERELELRIWMEKSVLITLPLILLISIILWLWFQSMTRQMKKTVERLPLADIVEYSDDAIVSKNLDGTITSWNQGAQKIYGYISREAVGHSIKMITLPGHEREVDDLIEKIRRGEHIRQYETRRKTKEGRIVDVSITISPILDHAERIAGAAVITRDITERKKAQEAIERLNRELNARTRQLEETNQELESFCYSVSHDLRAPLRAINGFAKVVLDDYADKLDEEGKRFLSVIQNNTVKMGRLIDDLLAFSRFGRQEMKRVPVPMEFLAQEISHEMKSTAPGRKIEFKVNPDIPAARADPALIRQVWINLISNAVKYTRPRETAHIEIGGDIQNGQSVYYVKDDGVGFDMAYSGKLFHVFQRLHTAEEFEGTGVGLAIVQRIVTRHGGRAWAEGRPGEGSVFYFSLPKENGKG